jgi:hemolysin activation/secretion protein
VGSPGGLTDRNRSEFFEVSRVGARADYLYLKGSVFHRVPLDRFRAGFSWSVRGQVQFSAHNLIGSEQLGAGGVNSVRGYEEGEVYKDNGVTLSHEFRPPGWSPWRSHTLQVYIFQDFAYVWSAESLPAERATELHSAGLGFDYYAGHALSLRAAYGHAFLDSGYSNTNKRGRWHVSANFSF